MIAVSKITGCVVRGSNIFEASLKEHGLPINISRQYAKQNSIKITAHIGRYVPNIYTPPC
jgi:hypothetical protein